MAERARRVLSAQASDERLVDLESTLPIAMHEAVADERCIERELVEEALRPAEEQCDLRDIARRGGRRVAEDPVHPADLAAQPRRDDRDQHLQRHRRQLELAGQLDERQRDAGAQRRVNALRQLSRSAAEEVACRGDLTGSVATAESRERRDLALAGMLTGGVGADPPAIP